MGFQRFVESDSGAIANLCDVHYVCNASFLDPKAAVMALTAGTDIEMGGRPVTYAIQVSRAAGNKLTRCATF